MKNANVLVGQLRVMAAREQNEILRDTVEYLEELDCEVQVDETAEINVK